MKLKTEMSRLRLTLSLFDEILAKLFDLVKCGVGEGNFDHFESCPCCVEIMYVDHGVNTVISLSCFFVTHVIYKHSSVTFCNRHRMFLLFLVERELAIVENEIKRCDIFCHHMQDKLLVDQVVHY